MSYRTSKRFCFTLNNYELHEYETLRDSIQAHCSYGIIGKEVGDVGTPHLQAFCIFRERFKLLDAKSRLNPRIHIEVARGTPRQNREYCRKGGDYWEQGECPKGGASSGKSNGDEIAREFVSRMVEGRSGLDRFINDRPGTWYGRGSVLLRNYGIAVHAEHRDNISVEWVYGEPGIGKSRYAHAKFPDAYIKDPRTKWWNNYMFEESVIIDDYAPGGVDINHLLRWFDRYKCYVETKGGMLALRAQQFIVTSNFHPRDCFRSDNYRFNNGVSESVSVDHVQLPALLRRIVIKHMI